jgi:multisubunit Na+/H+ antiporter MnhB subunit
VSTLVLRTVARVVVPLGVLYGLRLLFVGHDAPGGGFVGGLVTALAVLARWLAFGPPPPRRWERGVTLGVGVAAATGLAALLVGRPPLTHAVTHLGPVKVATSLVFDVGVYVLVVSATLAAVRTLWEATSP